MAVLQPIDIVDQGCMPCFNAAMIGVNRLVGADFRLGKVDAFLFLCKQFNVTQQAGLVALQRQDIVGPLVDDLPGDLALTAHGIDRDHPLR